MCVKQTNQINTPILMYHSISYAYTRKFRPFTVSPTLFAKQMEYIYQHGYTPITVTHLVNSRSSPSTTLPEHPVVLTFDDGFADFFTNALPVLKQYHFTATLYIPTAFIGGTSRWLRREGETTRPMVTWEQLNKIQDAGIECGGHTHSHPQLDTLSGALAHHEIVRCKSILEQHLGQQVMSFAYPFGYYTPQVQQLLYEAGYTSACAVKHAMCSEAADPLALTRLMVTTETNIESFARLLSGSGLSAAATLYMHARTRAWQVIRRSSTIVTRYSKKGHEQDDSNKF